MHSAPSIGNGSVAVAARERLISDLDARARKLPESVGAVNVRVADAACVDLGGNEAKGVISLAILLVEFDCEDGLHDECKSAASNSPAPVPAEGARRRSCSASASVTGFSYIHSVLNVLTTF